MPAITVYDGVRQGWFDAGAVAAYLAAWLHPAGVELREDLPAAALARGTCEDARSERRTALAEQLAAMRVRNPARQVAPRRPLRPELDYEFGLLVGRTRPTPGVVYDGNDLQRLAHRWLPEAERGPQAVRIWFTERLFATWDEGDRRYHARVSLYGRPSIISTAGMVHAPARERSFYLTRRLGLLGRSATGEPRQDFLMPEDPRTSEVAKGYAMQAVFHAVTGAPFCANPACRLFNAHWQHQMLAAQLRGDRFCARHRAALEAWRAAAALRRPEGDHHEEPPSSRSR